MTADLLHMEHKLPLIIPYAKRLFVTLVPTILQYLTMCTSLVKKMQTIFNFYRPISQVINLMKGSCV